MGTKAYFNRPARPIDLRDLWYDIANTREHLVLASAWFTDNETASRFIDSPARYKTVIFNAADINRGTKKAYSLIRSYFVNPVQWCDKWDEMEQIDNGGPGLIYGVYDSVEHGGYEPYDFRFRFIVLGSGNWQEGVMHHKFILCDQSVWMGSFNFTYQARKNYEALLRVDDRLVIREYYNEVNSLVEDAALYQTDGMMRANGAFRCEKCRRLLPASDMASMRDDDGYHSIVGESLCKRCNSAYLTAMV